MAEDRITYTKIFAKENAAWQKREDEAREAYDAAEEKLAEEPTAEAQKTVDLAYSTMARVFAEVTQERAEATKKYRAVHGYSYLPPVKR